MADDSGVFEFRLPSLGADMERGTILEWKVHPGDTVHRGDVVLAVETEKSDIDVEIWHDGVVLEMLHEVGESVEVGTALARLQARGAEPAAAAAPAERSTPEPSTPVVSQPLVPPPSPVPVASAAPPVTVAAVPAPSAEPHIHSPLVRHLAERSGLREHELVGTGPGGTITRRDVETAAARVSVPDVRPPARGSRPGASPLARRLARERSIDIAALHGSGPNGAVLRRDVDAAVTAPVPRPAAATDRSASMQAAIARQMARSKREIPHYYLSSTIDVSAAIAWLTTSNEQRPVERRILPAAMVLTAVARAAGRHPDMNGHWLDESFQPSPSVDLGVVVSRRGGGLLVPVIAGADQRSLEDVMAELKGLVTRVRSGRLRSSDTAPATITVTNLGDLGADAVFGVIHPPQVAIVGVGRVAMRPVVVDAAVLARPTVTVTVAADHRVSDGIAGSRFLSTIESLLAAPDQL